MYESRGAYKNTYLWKLCPSVQLFAEMKYRMRIFTEMKTCEI